MEDSETEYGNGDHDTVENDKVGLILHDWISPAFGHLSNTEDTTHEDGNKGHSKGANEQLPTCGCHELNGRGFEGRAMLVCSNGIVYDETGEDEEGEDLPYDTSKHKVVSSLLLC